MKEELIVSGRNIPGAKKIIYAEGLGKGLPIRLPGQWV